MEMSVSPALNRDAHDKPSRVGPVRAGLTVGPVARPLSRGAAGRRVNRGVELEAKPGSRVIGGTIDVHGLDDDAAVWKFYDLPTEIAAA